MRNAQDLRMECQSPQVRKLMASFSGRQRIATSGALAFRSVLRVTQNMMSQSRRVDADLVGASRFKSTGDLRCDDDAGRIG